MKSNEPFPITTLPNHLSLHEAQGLIQGEPVAQFEIGDYKNFVYLILDWRQREAAIIDPQKDLTQPLAALARHGFSLTQILLTHTHHDHVAGVPELMQKFSGISVRVHEHDLHRIRQMESISKAYFNPVQDGEKLSVGAHSIAAIHTPGHSSGECCYLLETQPPYLFTGDTVFIRDCGRTDLPTGSNAEMFSSLQRLKTLAPETIFLPGHHYVPECATTLRLELATSPPFKCGTVEELKALP